MNKPTISDRKPIAVELEKGVEKYFCACGKSKRQPFCDGAHKTTEFNPLLFKAKETGTAYLCMCKHTENPPYCDGAHAALKDEPSN